METVNVSGVGKCYRTNRAPSPWEQMKARFGRAGASSKRPREIWALKDVSFSVERGTVLGVIGPNGAGKTTLLKVLSRITPPTEGRIVGRGTVAPLLELGSGLQPDLTARENVALYATWHGVSRAALEQRMDEIVSFAEIGEFLDTPLKRFSSGMYVRLAFSIAVNMRPDILLADEILAVGDLAFQERCLQRVAEAGAAGMTVFFVSHDMAAIQRLCTRVICLNAGRVVLDGDAQTVVSRYEHAAWTLTAGAGKSGQKGHVANQHGQVLSVRLLSSDGREIGAARNDEEIHVAVTCTFLTPGMTVRCVLSLLTRGMVAFRTAQPEDVQVAEPGVFVVRVRIPPELLADTVYSVKLGILLHQNGEESKLVQDNALTFRVYGGDDPSHRSLLARDVYRGSSWSGAVMPRLDWHMSRQRGVDIVEASPQTAQKNRPAQLL
jgi:lipopolysaccharide transport system ATP-binding protein